MEDTTESPEMNAELLMKKIEEEFQGDPIYKKVISFNLKGKLFSDLYLLDSVDFTKHYSTKEAASFLGESIKEYRLTNTLSKESLYPYFQVTRKGNANRYLYDWQAIWRFKMVFLLADAGGMRLVELEKLMAEPFIQKKEEKRISVDAMSSKEDKVNVMIMSGTLDAIWKEIEDNKRSFKEAMEEMKTAASQRESENFSSLKEVLLQEYTHRVNFLEEVEEQLRDKQKRKRRIKIWILVWEFEEPFEELAEVVEKEKNLLNRKIAYLRNLENNTLTYQAKPRKRKMMNHNL